MEFSLRFNSKIPVYHRIHLDGYNIDMGPVRHRIDIENMLEKKFHTCDMGYYYLYGFERITRNMFCDILKNINPKLKENITAYSYSDLKQKMNERIKQILLYIADKNINNLGNVYYQEYLNKKDIVCYIKN